VNEWTSVTRGCTGASCATAGAQYCARRARSYRGEEDRTTSTQPNLEDSLARRRGSHRSPAQPPARLLVAHRRCEDRGGGSLDRVCVLVQPGERRDACRHRRRPGGGRARCVPLSRSRSSPASLLLMAAAREPATEMPNLVEVRERELAAQSSSQRARKPRLGV
jgi:hypothetical protein